MATFHLDSPGHAPAGGPGGKVEGAEEGDASGLPPGAVKRKDRPIGENKRPDSKAGSDRFQGWLLKWTNYIKGYQKRWFVVSNGLLSYYRTQEEMAHTCRGTINLAGACIDTLDATTFVITNGPSQVYLRVQNEVQRQRWVTMLELGKTKAIKKLESDDNESVSESDDDDKENPLASLKNKLQELSTAHDVVVKNSHALLQQIAEADHSLSKGSSWGKSNSAQLKEKLALFKLTASALVNVADDFVSQARNTDRRWSRALQQEHSLRLQLQDNLEALASQMLGLESHAQGIFHPQGSVSSLEIQRTPSTTSLATLRSHDDSSKDAEGVFVGRGEERQEEREEDEDEDDDDKFFDAPEILQEEWEEAQRDVYAAQTSSTSSLSGSPSDSNRLSINPDRTMSLPSGPVQSFFEKTGPTLETRREAIPPRPNIKLNLWSLFKNLIGKDLTKISMPVIINEPISILQRMVEDLSYADILEKGAACNDSLQELAHLAAFAVSSYCSATVAIRLGKPFNPLLGETYECDRRAELGWRCFLEQVTHHPPMFVMHVEHKDWTLWEEYTVASKFRGKYIVCYPIGNTHLVFHKSGNHYTWNKVAVTIHNIIVGKVWFDQSGDMRIVNHTTGDECNLRFHGYRYFSREQQRKVSGTVNDASGKPHWVVKGYWDEKMDYARILSSDGLIGPLNRLWTLEPPQPGYDKIYGFSKFTCTLNEMEKGMAPTDSRLRPDQRIMEEGDFDKANTEKLRLEEKQRAKRRKREALAAKAADLAAAGKFKEAAELEKETTYSPMWFKKEFDPLTNTMMHVYKGGYWEGKLAGDWCTEFPDIF